MKIPDIPNYTPRKESEFRTEIFVDKMTNVNYIVVISDNSIAITPRLTRQGGLFIG